MLTYAVPPGLPLMMVLIGTVGRWRLRKERMTLNFNEALSNGACADVVAFDKTGTLTHSAVSCSCCEVHKRKICHGFWPSEKAEHQCQSFGCIRIFREIRKGQLRGGGGDA